MKFDTPATTNPIDQLKVVGQPHDRIDGPLKTTGHAPYAYEHHEAAENPAYGFIVGSSIAKGRITQIDASAAKASPGVIGVVTWKEAGPLGKAKRNTAALLAGPEVEHYDQTVAIVVADSFENARAAAKLLRVDYQREPGRFDLSQQVGRSPPKGGESGGGQPVDRVGDFEAAFAAAPVKIDRSYSTPDQSHMMMEPHATLAAWDGDRLTVWTSNQMINWAKKDLATTLKIAPENVRVISPYVGGGFGGKLWVRGDALMAALAARSLGRPVKVALARPQIMNNTTHRPATVQRIRIGCGRDGRITAIAHESWSGDLPGGKPETSVSQTKLLYAGANRLTADYLAVLDLPEGNAMRAPGEAPGLMCLEVAMDEMAEALGMDPIEFRILNDTQVDPEKPQRRFSHRNLIGAMKLGADKFGWSRRNPRPGQVHDGRWLVGIGMAAGFRNNLLMKSAARVEVAKDGKVVVSTDMTDIGTGSYTIIAQTAAEMLGVPLEAVQVRLGDSSFPVSAGSGGQWGGNNSTAGVYAACVKLRQQVAQNLGSNSEDIRFEGGQVHAAGKSLPLAEAAGGLSAEDGIEYGDLDKTYAQSTFAGHFVEVGVDRTTGEVRVRRMLAVCGAGRIINPKSARSQVIGAMTMGVGAALMEDAVVDKRIGYFVNHDLAEYHVPVHLDIPHQEVIFLDETDPISSPMKAKGVGELGLCGVGAAVANAIYNATGVRVRDYPVTLDKLLDHLPEVA